MEIHILGFKKLHAVSAQILTVTIAKLMTTILKVFAYVKPASVVTAQNVHRWWNAVIVKTCIVCVASVILNVLTLCVQEHFVIPVIRPIDVSNVTEAGVTFVTFAWIALIAIKDTAWSAI